MAPSHLDEEAPLLPPSKSDKKRHTPLPWAQLGIILVLQLAEPLTSQVINPFAPQLIRDIGITHGDETRVGYYVGLMQSIFFATQAVTVLNWSRASDYVGRKPVILTGLFGLSLSMYCFGLSTTFWGLVVSRSLNGALNGNIGVMKSMIAEITDSTNIAQAYAYMPIAWSTGGTLGPIIGGSLSHPAERFPDIFGHSDFLKKYPYFLPCAVPATFSIVAWIVTFVFLKETVSSPRSISRILKFRKTKGNLTLQNVAASQQPNTTALPTPDIAESSKNEKPLPLKQLLTRRVLIAGGNYATLSLVDIAIRAMQPLFYSTPIELGGLGLPPSTIGAILSVFGILNGVFQIFFFAAIHDRWGTKRVFIAGVLSALPVFASFPIINALARAHGMCLLVWAAVGLQVVISIMLSLSYGCVFIYISAASPNRASLGAVNGMAQMSVSIMRTIGPGAANGLFAMSVKQHDFSIVYSAMCAVTLASLLVAALLPRHVWNA
ncbi:hypothetical protein PLICRDRAFT_39984 [Plicaturopsis crispa FD-325 SS-3]|nr:hypothetical protein PLICRDRAFT_39984 [Plicaturopsis crispa FD-325 SS-3]